MKNFRNFFLAVSVMVGISAIESTGIYFWIALAMVFIPLAILGIDEWKKQRKYEQIKKACENVDFLTDVVMFGEWEMLN